MTVDAAWLAGYLRDVPDFPQPGITFKDVAPLLGDPVAFRAAVDGLAEGAAGRDVTKVAGIEARGFIFASAVAHGLGAGFVPIRKPGKLPWRTVSETYELEYGTDTLQVHDDALVPGEAVYVIDDVLATGGTAAAACRLVERLGGRVAGIGFVLELGFLGGRARIPDYDVISLITVP